MLRASGLGLSLHRLAAINVRSRNPSYCRDRPLRPPSSSALSSDFAQSSPACPSAASVADKAGLTAALLLDWIESRADRVIDSDTLQQLMKVMTTASSSEGATARVLAPNTPDRCISTGVLCKGLNVAFKRKVSPEQPEPTVPAADRPAIKRRVSGVTFAVALHPHLLLAAITSRSSVSFREWDRDQARRWSAIHFGRSIACGHSAALTQVEKVLERNLDR